MTAILTIVCDAPHCPETSTPLRQDVPTARRILARNGWVRASVNGRPVDYCQSHAILAGVKTCRSGHVMDAANTYVRANGGRECRACAAALRRRVRAQAATA